MTMNKKELEKHVRETREAFEKTLLQKRVEWLQQILKEARDRYSFKTLGELIAWIVDHASAVSHAENEP